MFGPIAPSTAQICTALLAALDLALCLLTLAICFKADVVSRPLGDYRPHRSRR